MLHSGRHWYLHVHLSKVKRSPLGTNIVLRWRGYTLTCVGTGIWSSCRQPDEKSFGAADVAEPIRPPGTESHFANRTRGRPSRRSLRAVSSMSFHREH